MKNKRGEAWTINKLITIIMFTLILIFIIVGMISGGLNPLFDKLKSSWNNAAERLGIAEKETDIEDMPGSQGCQDWREDTIDGEKIQFRECPGYCELEIIKDNTNYVPGETSPLENPCYKYNVKGGENILEYCNPPNLAMPINEFIDFNQEEKEKIDNILNEPYYSKTAPEAMYDAKEIYDELKVKLDDALKINIYVGSVVVIVQIVEKDYTLKKVQSFRNSVFSEGGIKKELINPLKGSDEIVFEGKDKEWLNPQYPLSNLIEIKTSYNYLEKYC